MYYMISFCGDPYDFFLIIPLKMNSVSYFIPFFIRQRSKLLLLFTIVLLSVSLIPVESMAQEFKCSVTVDKSKINSTSLDYLKSLKSIIEDYFNNYSWTNDHFQDEERIKFNLQIILNSVDNSYNFSATAIFSSTRPIYNTVSSTPVIIVSDNWNFNYPPNKTLIHNQFQFDDMASFLDFYAYIILGYDYDTFSSLGGTPYFKKARGILDLAQSAGGGGWSSSAGQQSRYTLITDLLDPNYEDLRKAYYIYHLKGLDLFTTDATKARSNILEAFKLIQDAQRSTTTSYPFDLVFNTKFREFVSVFADANLQNKLAAYRILIDIDPGHISEYDKLK